MATEPSRGVFEHVVSNDLCVGCGVCAGMSDSALEMEMNGRGAYEPKLKDESSTSWQDRSLRSCPFTDEGENEDGIARALFADQPAIEHRSESGYYLNCYAGRVTSVETRLRSSSGGIITWVATQLLKSGAVDAVACVGSSPKEGILFEYKLVREAGELTQTTSSKYYPVEASGVIEEIRRFDGRVLFIGLPCFLKALRKACAIDPELERKIAFTIGLFCGHLKSAHYAEYLSRRCGVEAENIETVNFRKKLPDRPANDYAFEVQSNAPTDTRQVRMSQVPGGSWSYNLFMLRACEYCDDVMAETADLAVGDAWLPRYVKDGTGTSIVVCRTAAMREQLQRGVAEGAIDLDDLSVDDVIRSQAGGLRQRRGGLRIRLALAARKGLWRPKKRVDPARSLWPTLAVAVQRLRMKTRQLSGDAFLSQRSEPGLARFDRALKPWIGVHFVVRVVTFAKKRISGMLHSARKRRDTSP